MTLYAIDDLEDALAATRALLLPVDPGRWLRLAVVVFFVSGASGPGAQLNFPPTTGDMSVPGGIPGTIDLGPRAVLLAAAVGGAVLLLGIAFLFVSSVMEFVFVAALRTETVVIGRRWRDNWRRGLRLFGFRIVLAGVTIAIVGGLVGAALLPAFGGSPILSILAVVVLLPAIVALALLAGVVHGFTTAFVVPIMLMEKGGVLAGWRRLWPTLRAQWMQFLAYAIAGFLLSIAGGIVVGLVTAVIGAVLLVPFGLVGAVGFVLLSVLEPVGILLLVVAGVLFALSILAVAALAQVPVQTYLRYYALFVLGDANPELDPIPDRRATVRSEDA